MFSHASHNRAYTLVWNEEHQAWVPAPETSRARGKRSGRALVAMAGLLASAAAYAVDPSAHPTGGTVVAGNATVTQSGNTTIISQGSSKAIIDWQTFDVGSHSAVDFLQPSSASVALNRVVGQDPTQILGSLHANGQVFIVNANGVLFARGAQVSAAGILASTRDLSNDGFMAGRLTFSGAGTGEVTNHGALTAGSKGYVVLVGAQVLNDGLISAPGGDVRMAAADQVTLRIDGAGLTSFEVDRGALAAMVANHGVIRADGGRIYLTAVALDKLAKSQVNNTGLIEAQTVGNDNGTIVLKGDMDVGTVTVGGTLDASAPNGGSGGNIETSAAHVDLTAAHHVTTAAASGAAGHWLIDPTNFTIAASGGDETPTQLGFDLASGNVEIQSNSGSGGTAGNVSVNDPVSWSANRLTLTAQNNVLINANLTGTGTAALTLKVGQGAVNAGNTSSYVIAPGVSVSLPTGNNFSTVLGSDGASLDFDVINSLGSAGSTTGTDLQGIQGQLNGLFALGSDIVATGTSGWNTAAGFTPIGTTATPFTGRLEGLGHTISNLSINLNSDQAGLLGVVGASGVVSNLVLSGVNVSANNDVGGLVGHNDGTLSNVAVSGSVSGAQNVGGVAGTNDTGASIIGASANVSILGSFATGGLIGLNAGAVVASSSAGDVSSEGMIAGGLIGDNSANLSGLTSSAYVHGVNVDQIGGLVGHSTGSISNSTASGNVSGASQAGGLVGATTATISSSQAFGNVSGTSQVGGLAGYSTSNVSNTTASGAVSASGDKIGGLVGEAFGSTITGSSAIGAVASTGLLDVGGLVGALENASISQPASVSDSSASGTVSGTKTGGGGTGNVGGLVGLAQGSITTSSATGNVRGTSNNVGGLVGNNAATITGSDAKGTVFGENSTGGLVGLSSASISDSSAAGAVTGDSETSGTGGLVGQTSAAVVNSTASGTVNGNVSVGGLVGILASNGSVSGNSLASGNVTALATAGGLVGEADASTTINGASASGSVSATGAAGGLVGLATGTSIAISNVTASGHATASGSYAGGLAGDSSAAITQATATGGASGATDVGGLVGELRTGASIGGASSASGTVHASSGAVGGAVGTMDSGSQVTNTSSTASVTGSGNGAGGLVGVAQPGVTIANVNVAASVNVTGNRVGGLVGDAEATLGSTPSSIIAATVSGTVRGGSDVGGLIGHREGAGGPGIALSANTTSASVQGTSSVGGLIGYNDGTVSGAPITGNQAFGAVSATSGNAGGYVGYNSGGAISAVTLTATSTVTAGADNAGGLVGANVEGTIASSSASATVHGVNSVGGLVGLNNAGLSGVSASGNVSGTGANVGGLVGFSSAGLSGVSASGNVSGTGANVGGLVGEITAGVTNSQASGNVTASGTNVGGLIGEIWGNVDQSTASGAVVGSHNSGGLVGNTHGNISNSQASGSVVSNNSAVGGLTGDAWGNVTNSTASGNVSASLDYVGGLIGFSEYQTHVTGSSASGTVSGRNQVGGLVGQMQDGTLSLDSASGNVTATGGNVGGLVGWLDSYYSPAVIDQSSASGSVTAARSSVGGLLGGSAGRTATLSNSHAAGAVSSSGRYVGGLVGYFDGAQVTNVYASGNVGGSIDVGGLIGTVLTATVDNSWASGNVSGVRYDIGGLAGWNAATITNSHATGNVTSTTDGYVGGLVGESTGTIADSYATGAVHGMDYVGGLAGALYNNVTNVSASGAAFGRSYVGGLAGTNYGIATHATATGNVTAARSGGQDAQFAGGLFGINFGYGTTNVSNSTASGNVSGQDYVGGLIGLNVTGSSRNFGDYGGTHTVSNSSSSGTVSGRSYVGGLFGSNNAVVDAIVDNVSTISTVTATGSDVGGIAGENASGGVISHYATTVAVVATSGGWAIGGVVGINAGTVSDAHAGNAVTSDGSAVGGLVGDNASGATIVHSWASNSVVGGANVGGLVGTNEGSISVSYAANNVTGTTAVGGLVGAQSAGSIATAYSMSTVSGSSQVGGLVGNAAGGTVTDTYAAGPVAGAATTGGLFGTGGATVIGNVYDAQTTGQAHSVGDLSQGEVAASKTTAQMEQASTYANWSLNTDGSHNADWRLYVGAAAPLLEYWLTPLAVTVNSGATSHVYDGTVHTSPVAGLTYTDTLQPGHVLGAPYYTNALNVGTYATLGGLYSDQHGYDMQVTNNGALTIAPATLTAALTGVTKVYDGTDAATLASGNFVLLGFVAGEGATITQTAGLLNGANVVGTNSVSATLSAGEYAANGATLMSNYVAAPTATGVASITPKGLTMTAVGSDKVYDGTVSATSALTVGGLIGSDTVTASGTAAFADKNAATSKTVMVGDIVLSGADATNYMVTTPALTTTATITPKAISVTATGVDKVYDGATADQAVLSSSGLVYGDSMSFAGSSTFADKNAGSGKLVSVVGISASGADAGNYTLLNTTDSTTASITPRQIIVSASGGNKVYDGATATNTAVTETGVVANDNVSFSGTAAFSDKNAGVDKRVTTNIAGSGTDLGNYSFNTSVASQATIAPRAISLTTNGSDKVYDGSTLDKVTIGSSGVVAGDSISFTGVSGFADKNTGLNKAVSVIDISAAGADAGNYAFATTGTTMASVTPRRLTVSLEGNVTKISDGFDAATLSPSNYLIGNVTQGDLVSITQLLGTYADGQQGMGKSVSVSLGAGDYSARGDTLLSNYTLATGTISGNIGIILPSLKLLSAQATLPSAAAMSSRIDSAARAPQFTDVQQGDTTTEAITVQEAARAAALASNNTRDNLLYRRTFSIGDGGIRLPAGVRGSEKDASQ